MNEKIDPKQAILLVMDYQNGIVNRIPNVEPIITHMTETLTQVRAAGLAVGYVRVAMTDEEFAAVPATNKSFSAAAATRAMHADAPETQVIDAVKPQPDDIVVRKRRVGAFSTTDLHEQLQARGITTLILAGFSTSGVVLSTVRDAADKDYRLFVIEDLTADGDPEVHDLLMQKVFPRQAQVITADTLTGLLATA